jgi:EAL domain-containing protein (putative c-di-GMP-specific phosphodiesterase class I)/CheY-like chemotaxis protein
MSDGKRKVLVVDDDADLGIELCETITTLGYDAELATEGSQAREAIARGCDLLLLDLSMPGTDGLDLLQTLAESSEPPVIVLMSGYGEAVLQAAARSAQISGLPVRAVLPKPLEIDALVAALAQQAEQKRAASPESLFDLEQVANAMERGVADGSLTVMHQPKVNVHSLAFVGTEALLPAVIASIGPVPPPVQVAACRARPGLLETMSCYVVKESLKVCAEWRRRGFEGPVSVNMPVELLNQAGIEQRMRNLCDEAGLPTAALTLELTEDALYDASAAAMATLTRLRMAGFGLALDDLGQRASGLVQLANLPVTEVKIDADLIWQARKWQKAGEIVASIADLARRVKLKVTAEGIETKADLRFAAQAGVDNAQGWLIQRKLTPADLLAWLPTWPASAAAHGVVAA